MSLPKISIIMPVFNSVDTIEKAIKSLLAQDYDNVEFIVMDGGSTDGTLEVIKKYRDQISHWSSQHDGSAVVAINNGIKLTTGDLVATLMADDWYEPKLLSKIAKAYQEHPEADMFTCGGDIIRSNGEGGYSLELSFDRPRDLALTFFNICFASSAICCRFIKKSFYQRIGLYEPFDKNGVHMYSNDKEFLLRAVLNGVKDIFVPYLGYRYLAHEGSATLSSDKKRIIRLIEEHLMIAKQYLHADKPSFKQKLLLHYWYIDQSSRLIVYQLLTKNKSSAKNVLIDVVKKYHLFFPIGFLSTTLHIAVKKFASLLRKKIYPTSATTSVAK